MQQPTPMSLNNRTGMQRSPLDAQQMLAPPQSAAPPAHADGATAAALRGEYIIGSDAVGSIPAPATPKGMAKAGLQALMGNRAQALVDKLGERLAFERSGTRLYEAMILKCQTLAASDPQSELALPIEALRAIRADEAGHAELLAEALQKLGGDPTAQTPSADVTGVEGMGLLQVLNDPRTTPTQCLHALLTAELTDNASWELLIDMAQTAGEKELAERFQAALLQESRHLALVKTWHRDAVMTEARLLSAMAMPSTA